MSDIMRKLILKKYPNYDFDRQRFESGDYIETLDGAKILVKESALEYVSAYVIKRSLKYREKGLQRVYYEDLPYFEKNTFINKLPKLETRLNWKVYDFVHLDFGDMTVMLTEEIQHQSFYAFVLNSENKYYLHTVVYLENPFKDYVEAKGV